MGEKAFEKNLWVYMRTNEEVYRIYQELDLVTIIKTSMLKWPYKHNVRSQRAKESATGYSWEWKMERITKKQVAG
jgi:hypothetical protein